MCKELFVRNDGIFSLDTPMLRSSSLERASFAADYCVETLISAIIGRQTMQAISNNYRSLELYHRDELPTVCFFDLIFAVCSI